MQFIQFTKDINGHNNVIPYECLTILHSVTIIVEPTFYLCDIFRAHGLPRFCYKFQVLNGVALTR